MAGFDFDRSVLERSKQVPVLVDFWAEWCGPCRVLGPTLDKLAADANGRFELVKIDVDAHPEIARDFGIQGIPAVKLFADGRERAEFVGALPASEIERWLDRYLPDPRAGSLETVAARWASEGPGVASELEALVEREPDYPLARMRLAQAIASTDPVRARRIVAETNGDAETVELAEDVRALADLAAWDEPFPEKAAPHFEAARDALKCHDLDRALEALVDAAMRDRTYGDGLARRVAVALFRMLGERHELTEKYRRGLSMALNA